MFARIYKAAVVRHQKKITFVVLLSFLVTFIWARLIVYLIDAEVLPDFYLAVGQTHVHHLNYGIFLLAGVGYLSLIFNKQKVNERLAILYGIGLALTFDEFALWLRLENDYYARITYEAVIIIVAIFINIVYLGDIWKRIWLFTTGQSKEKI